jgi:hypothetical protein
MHGVSGGRHLRACLLAAAAALAGCSALLPSGSSQVRSAFDSFDAARQALEAVVPFRTTFGELKALGFDPQASTNVTLIPYPEIVARLAPHPGVPLEELDAGVRACIVAQAACRAFLFRLGHQRRARQGPFLPDFLSFRRTTLVTGWRFEGLVVLRDDVVVFRNFAGEARIDTVERQVNPLGPLQPAGEASGQYLLR